MRDDYPLEAPASEEARVVFFGTVHTYPFPIYADKEVIGYAEAKCFFEVSCEPGEHIFSSPGHKGIFGGGLPVESVVTATLAPGKTYFIEAAGKPGNDGSFFTRLTPITRESDHWEKVERQVRRYQPRTLAEVKRQTIRAFDRGTRERVAEGSRLNPEDGR